MRSGNEPNNARSPLGLRLVFAGFGLLAGLIGLVALLVAGEPGWALAFGALAVVAALDVVVIVIRIRQGPHFQPGPSVPPYAPADPEPRPPREGLSRPTRMRLYFALMGSCLLLFVLDGLWIRQLSTTAAVVVGLFAACLPPVAAIVANTGRRPPPE
jgi:drug/metabolite transporter (DMT)-like permease